MSDMKRVNPALMLEAGKLVAKGRYNSVAYLKTDGSGEVRIQKGYTARMKADREFNPLTSDSDAWALERALRREGWQFRFQCGCYWVRNDWRRGEGKYLDAIGDPSDTLLLLKCVSAMTSIPLYAEESMG